MTFHKFIDKLFQLTSYEKEYTRSAVTCRYSVPKEFIIVSIADQETMEIDFAVITPPENSFDLYIDTRVGNSVPTNQ